MKLRNAYVEALGPVYAETPKAVFAALAYSFAERVMGEELGREATLKLMAEEWDILTANGLVPQSRSGSRGWHTEDAAEASA